MKVLELTKDNFEKEALQSSETVLIDFWAAWCAPCKMLSPIIDEIAEEGLSGVKVCKVNIDQQPELAQQFHVMSIPTLVVLKDGKIVQSTVGVQPKEVIIDMVTNA